jgi:preprotein translocase subunit Sss1
MSDMSFKQAKELIERLELSELTLKSTLDKLDDSTNNFNTLLNKENNIYKNEYIKDNKIANLKILISLNIGFIIGLLVSKYFL